MALICLLAIVQRLFSDADVLGPIVDDLVEGKEIVPTRSPKFPNYQERIALEAVRGGRAIPTGPKIIETLLAKGWLERVTTAKYRITQAGIEAVKLKIPDGK